MTKHFAALLMCMTALSLHAASGGKQLIAHRGASGYAPEQTRAAYLLAIQQGADFVEQDLVLTKDGELVCLHDVTLERTTNVEEIFPDRFVERPGPGGPTKHWMAYDFTLAEIKKLDAGSWFDARFAGERVLTFQEAIDLLKDKVGLYPELKSPEVYRTRAVEMAPLVIDILRRNGLDTSNRLILQSFDEAAKQILDARPDAVKWAHDAGLTVTPYTFRAGATGRFASVREEMRHFLYQIGVDGVFTDNPDQFPAK